MRRLVPLILVASSLGSCATDGPSGTAVETSGDTTIVTSPAVSPEVVEARIEILWQSDQLERPGPFAALGDTLIVGDRTQIHFLLKSGAHIRTVGRRGEGPGEYQNIVRVGTQHDTILVHDPRLQRMSLLDPTGTYIDSRRITPHAEMPNGAAAGPATLWPAQGGFLHFASGLISTSEPTPNGLLLTSIATDSTTVVERYPGTEWTRLGDRVLTPTVAFGPRVVGAVGPHGTYAVGTGADYCFDVRALRTNGTLRVCRRWNRVPFGEEFRHPDLESYGLTEINKELLELLVNEASWAEALPSYSLIVFASDGHIWVMTMGPEVADVHPSIIRQVEGLDPPYRAWDVFDPRGHLERTVRLPYRFQLRYIEPGAAYGVLELDTGELIVARAVIPEPIANTD